MLAGVLSILGDADQGALMRDKNDCTRASPAHSSDTTLVPSLQASRGVAQAGPGIHLLLACNSVKEYEKVKGAPEASLTRDASAALERMEKE